MVFNECRANMATHRWVNKKTGESSLLSEIFTYSSIAWLGSLITSLGLMLFDLYSYTTPDIVRVIFNISVASYFATALMMITGGAVELRTCDYVESSKEEQRLLRERRINAEGPSFLEKISMTCKSGKDQIPERVNSSDEGSKQRNYSFLRQFNLIGKFYGRKNTEEHCLLTEFNANEEEDSLFIRELKNRRNNSSGVSYGATGKTTSVL